MADQGQPETAREKSLLFNYGAAFFGVIVGALAAPMLFGSAIDNPPLASAVGGTIGGVVGFAIPGLLKKFGALKAE